MVRVFSRFRGGLGAAVTHAEHNRAAGIITKKTNHHLIADFRTKKCSAFLACIQCGNACPDSLLRNAHQRKPYLYAIFTLRIAFQNRDNPDLQAADTGKKTGGRQWTKVVSRRKYFRIQTELNIRLPVAVGYGMANPRNIELSLKTLPYAAHLDDFTGQHTGKPLKAYSSAHLCQTLFQQPAISPGLQFRLAQFAAMADGICFAANHIRQSRRRKVAVVSS